MFFELSKILWTLAQPVNLLFIFLAIATLLLWWRPPVGRVMITVLVVLAWIAAAFPIGDYYLREIENKYPVPALSERVDGIILLGGFTWPEGTEAHHQLQTDAKADRFLIFAQLAQKYPDAKLVFTGGSGNPLRQDVREADLVKELWINLGYDPARVMWERESRNTYENALFSKNLANPQPGENWVLVTSALHMPRSVAIFEKQDWKVIPYPADYVTNNQSIWRYEFSVMDNLWRLMAAMREILGMFVYQMTDRAA